MKEGLPTPSEIDISEKDRLSLEEAQEMANLILTKLDGQDLKNLGSEDYERAMSEIETLKSWADGKETRLEDVKEVLVKLFASVPVLMSAEFLGHLESVVSRFPDLHAYLTGAVAMATVGQALGAVGTRRSYSRSELYQLDQENKKRMDNEE